MEAQKILIKKLNNYAKMPFKSTKGSAGFDVTAAIEKSLVIKKGYTLKVPSGIALGIPSKSIVTFLIPRSGLSINYGITLANSIGVIDSDYTGEIIVGLKNLGNKDYEINPGDKIAQILFLNLANIKLKLTDELPENKERGANGFGSTGR